MLYRNSRTTVGGARKGNAQALPCRFVRPTQRQRIDAFGFPRHRSGTDNARHPPHTSKKREGRRCPGELRSVIILDWFVLLIRLKVFDAKTTALPSSQSFALWLNNILLRTC